MSEHYTFDDLKHDICSSLTESVRNAIAAAMKYPVEAENIKKKAPFEIFNILRNYGWIKEDDVSELKKICEKDKNNSNVLFLYNKLVKYEESLQQPKVNQLHVNLDYKQLKEENKQLIEQQKQLIDDCKYLKEKNEQLKEILVQLQFENTELKNNCVKNKQNIGDFSLLKKKLADELTKDVKNTLVLNIKNKIAIEYFLKADPQKTVELMINYGWLHEKDVSILKNLASINLGTLGRLRNLLEDYEQSLL